MPINERVAAAETAKTDHGWAAVGDPADSEWRFNAEVVIRRGPLSGFIIDYRDFGKITTGVFGLKFWL